MSPNLSRSRSVMLAIGALSALAVLIVALAYGWTESERATIDGASSGLVQLRSTAGQLSDAIHSQESALGDYLLTKDNATLARFNAAVDQEREMVTLMTTEAVELPDVRAAVAALATLSDRWQTTFARPAIDALQAGSDEELARLIRTAVADNDPFDAALASASAALEREEADGRAETEGLARVRMVATVLGLAVMLLASTIAMWLIRVYRKRLEGDAVRAGILNRFTEVTAFAADDASVAASNLEALRLLAHPDAAVTHVLNRSKDRAFPEASLGNAIAEVLPLNALARCPGLVRSSMHVTSDASAPLSVRCPIYPVESGTLACIPLLSGESVGAVHLYWERPNGLPLELQAAVVRVAEHAALAIGNWRLLAVLQGQADTDPRTGLANSRSFDRAVENALASRTLDETLAVLMLDLDHFKDFNDRHGHPAGDEALRTFAGVLQSCVRDGDVVARYGGEEFAILLPRVDADAAVTAAERVRARTESTIVSLAPGITDRLAVSIGVALAPEHGLDRIALLRIADDALYAAKSGGRNRVVLADRGSEQTSISQGHLPASSM